MPEVGGQDRGGDLRCGEGLLTHAAEANAQTAKGSARLGNLRRARGHNGRQVGMTKRLTVALLCAAATFASVAAGTAEARTLSIRTAKALAKELAKKQLSGRDVISFYLLDPKRLSPNRVVFHYGDRSRDHVFCTARVIVSSVTRGRTTHISARFAGQRCAGIPSGVLKFEAYTRRAQRDLRAN